MNSAQDEFDALRNGHIKSLHSQPENASLSSSDNDSATLHSSTYHDDEPMLASTPPMPSAIYHIPSTTHFTANTGPKGVIADARSFDLARKQSFRQTLHAFTTGQSPPLLGRNKSAGRQNSREKSTSSEDEEDDFMRTWRANRMEELSNMSAKLRTRRHSPSQRKYGSLVAVDPAGYLDAVEKVPADTIVVVFIYDDEVGALFWFPPSPAPSGDEKRGDGMVGLTSNPKSSRSSATLSRMPCGAWPGNITPRALSKFISSTPRWTISPCRESWPTRAATASRTWSPSTTNCPPVGNGVS